MSDEKKSEGSADKEPKPLGENAGVYIPSDGSDEEPPIDFGSFILSLGTSAYVSMGRVEHPDFGAAEKDLPAAQQVIDILVMLQGKTRGNLEEEENRLLAGLIYELKMAYIEAQ